MEINKRIEQSEKSHKVSSYRKIKQSDILRDRAEVSNLNLGFKLETTFFCIIYSCSKCLCVTKFMV